MKEKFEIRQIDAWMEDEYSWIYNETWHIDEFETSGDVKRAFMRALHKRGISCKRGQCYISFDGDVYEVRNRKTDEPFFAAVPMC